MKRKGVVCLILGFCCLAMSGLFSLVSTQEVPTQSQLIFDSDKLRSLKLISGQRYGSDSVRFQLLNGRWFQFSSKSGRVSVVFDALQNNQGGEIQVGYSPQNLGSPVGDAREFFNVFSLSVNGQVVNSYQDISSSWHSDEEFGSLMGRILLISSVFLLLIGTVRYRF